jgi:hypothetical protein
MTTAYWLALTLFLMCISFLVGYAWVALSERVQVTRLTSERSLALKEASDLADLVRQLTVQLNETIETSEKRHQATLEAGTRQIDDWKRRAEEYRVTVESVLKQRDQWCDLYNEQSIGHGNAQAIMMDAIAFLERKLRQAGVEVTLPPVVRETQELYRDRHVEPALAHTGGPALVRGSDQAPGNVRPLEESTCK